MMLWTRLRVRNFCLDPDVVVDPTLSVLNALSVGPTAYCLAHNPRTSHVSPGRRFQHQQKKCPTGAGR